ENDYSSLKNELLFTKNELANLRRMLYGQRSERFIPAFADTQLELALGVEPLAVIEEKKEHVEYDRVVKQTTKVTPHGRMKLSADLPRVEVIIEPQEDVTGLKKIGEEITEELEYKPGQLYVQRYVRPKYAKENGQGVVIGVLPNRPIEKGIAGPGLLAHVAISKFMDHLPLYRQSQIYKRDKVEIAVSTLSDWMKYTSEVLTPLYELHRDQILSCQYIMADETPIKVLDKEKKGSTHLGYLWAYNDPLERQVLFDYRPSRSREGPQKLLAQYNGHIQTDGYVVYDEFEAQPGITLLGCFAHARRYFEQAQDNDHQRSEWMLTVVQKLYLVEKKAREGSYSHEQRYLIRQEEAVPVLKEIKAWLDSEILIVLPRSAIGKAIAYMYKRWPRLEKYVTDGRLEIDNNLVENAIRPIALGRKNYLFAGSHEGAKRAALYYSLLGTAKLQGIEPFEYLRDVLTRISDYPYKNLADLLPANWKKIREDTN
ncbi:MAG: IS66 family transposase, partial [Smithella sp.]|nr:IS66 family transposase [Smithella sp.]